MSRPSGETPNPASQLLRRAASMYLRGNLREAETACERLLQTVPNDPDGLHIVGLIAWRRGNMARAMSEIRAAIARAPRKAQPHNSLGVLLKESGDLFGAEAEFRTALELMPNYAEALTNLGNVLCETGRLAEAETMHRRATESTPRYANAHNNLATALSRQERWEEAVEECHTAVRLDPTRADFQVNLGNALSATQDWGEAASAFRIATQLAPSNADAHANLGIALFHLDRPEEAVVAHRIATELRPDSARIWTNLGVAQVDLGNPDAALVSCRKALELDANLPEAHNCIGQAFKAKDMPAEAIAAYETAIRVRPDYHKGYNNLGTVLHAQGRFEDAMAAYATAVELMPSYAEAQWNKGMLHLLLGEFEPGWRGYERGLDVRRARARFRYHQFDMWDGATIAGKTIVVTGEQGIGDQIMFASLFSDLVDRGIHLLAKVEDRLHPLLLRSIKGLTLVSNDDVGSQQIDRLPVDYWMPIGSLCRWLRPDLASFPSHHGYLTAERTQVEALRRRYRKCFGDRPLVGISWRGGSGQSGQLRSMPLTDWAPILTQRDLGFVNLQYGDCRSDLAAVRSAIGVEVVHDDRVDPLKDLDSFAAQTAAMDLIVSIDNSTVHMAGALNVPVWVMLPAVPDWRWMLDRSDSPWYPSMRLFRQSKAKDWVPVISGIANELARADILGGAGIENVGSDSGVPRSG